MSDDEGDLVLFQGQNTLEPGQAEYHAFADRLFGRKLSEVKSDFAHVSAQISEMVSAMEREASDRFNLKTVEVSLAFSAKGKLVFIAEAGIQASVKIALSPKGQ